MNQPTTIIIDNAIVSRLGAQGIIVTPISMAIKRGQVIDGIPKYTQGTRRQDNKLISRLISGTTIRYQDIFTTCIMGASVAPMAPVV